MTAQHTMTPHVTTTTHGSALGRAAYAVAPVAGSVLGVGFRALARARAAKGIHPRGAVFHGRLHRQGMAPPTGVPWLDTPGEDRVLVRFSRGAGLPPPLPDVLGLALRILPDVGEPGDLLLSSAGRPRVARHLILPRRDPRRSGYTSIVPFGTPSGPRLIGAFPDGAGVTLQAAAPGGPWVTFGRVDLEAAPSTDGADADIEFDPMLHGIPGLRMPAVLARLREPSYRASRQGRRAAGAPPSGD